MTAAEVKRLYKGLDRKTPDGLMALLRRADEWRLMGKMSAGSHNAIIHSIKEQRHLYNVESLRREVAELREAMKTLLEERKLQLADRDIGPPEDALH